MSRAASVKPEIDDKIINFCITGVPKDEAFKRLGSKRTLRTRLNTIYRIAFWLQDLHELKEKHKNEGQKKIRQWKPETYIRYKTTMHPDEIESITSALLEAGWKPKIS